MHSRETRSIQIRSNNGSRGCLHPDFVSGGCVAVPLSSRRMERHFELLLSQVICQQLSMDCFV